MRSKSMKYAAAALAATLPLAIAAEALAATGSGTIAGAQVVPWDVQQFGNTSLGSVPSGGCHRQFWLISAQAGDLVTIDFESSSDPGLTLIEFPTGTTDFTVGQTNRLQADSLNSNGAAEATYTIPTTGQYPLDFNDECDGSGPYDFTARVAHGVVVGLPRQASLPATGTIAVAAHTPDGAPIPNGVTVTLEVTTSTSYNPSYGPIGSAAVVNGVANVSYTVPASMIGKQVSLRATAMGAGYQTTSSNTQTVTVAAAPKPSPSAACTTAAAQVSSARSRLHRLITHHAKRRAIAKARASLRRANTAKASACR